ncbi:MAG: polysaccharide deacetylase family protein [Thermodesulfobacteriota bacterium]
MTYHSHRILGESYDTNDHHALHEDLRLIHREGFRIVPLGWVAEWAVGRRGRRGLERAVALTFDDGADFDFHDIVHLTYGAQRSFFNILRDFQAEVGVARQPHLHASAFVIASPTVRHELDTRSMDGRGWMSDGWWAAADRSGLMAIHNHSWDHNHPIASTVCQEQQRKGSFEWIATERECRREVEDAAWFIFGRTYPAWPALFAYPGGRSSDYLREVYFPRSVERHRTLAAFGGSGGYVTRSSPRWNLPRFVCGAEWGSPEGLQAILREAA